MPRVKPLVGTKFEPRWKEWEKRMYETYHAMLLNTRQLGEVLGMTSYDKIHKWADRHGIVPVMVSDRKKKYDVRDVAKAIDQDQFRAIS